MVVTPGGPNWETQEWATKHSIKKFKQYVHKIIKQNWILIEHNKWDETKNIIWNEMENTIIIKGSLITA